MGQGGLGGGGGELVNPVRKSVVIATNRGAHLSRVG